MRKKHKLYPDECPVFRLEAIEYQWDGAEVQVIDAPEWRRYLDCQVEVAPFADWCPPRFPVEVRELRPLTPAAEDLLAAIKAELAP